MLFVRLFGLCLFKFVGFLFLLGLGRAAVCDCGTPWTFLLPFCLEIWICFLLKCCYIFKDLNRRDMRCIHWLSREITLSKLDMSLFKKNYFSEGGCFAVKQIKTCRKWRKCYQVYLVPWTLSALQIKTYAVDSRYLEFQGTIKYFEISVLRHIRFAELGKKIEKPHLTYIYVNEILKLEIYWKYCGKRSNFSSFPQYFLPVIRCLCLGRDQIFTSR